jgi:hypothetical protein
LIDGNMKNIFYPSFPIAWLPRMLACAAVGAIIAGIYGIIHDQFTYSISEEYFTRLKFAQFQYADFGLPRRIYVAEIGFLATWWVGFVAGWFFSRVALPGLPGENLIQTCRFAFVLMFVLAAIGTFCGYLLGLAHGPNYESWLPVAYQLQVKDVPAFVRVAYIHNASYAGGFIGLVCALVCVRRATNKCKPV